MVKRSAMYPGAAGFFVFYQHPNLTHIMIETGKIFSSSNLQAAIEDWSVAERFKFRVPRRDKTRIDYRCSEQKSGCTWRVYASAKTIDDERVWQVVIVHALHNCMGSTVRPRATANSQSWLQRVVPEIMIVRRDTKPQAIIDAIRMRYSEQVNYQAAEQCKSVLVGARAQQETAQLSLLPVYLQALRLANPFCYTHNETTPHVDDNITTFRRVFICPTQSQLSFITCKQFLAIDGTFLKGFYAQTLLLAVTVDANGQYLLLAWAVVESKNKNAWEYFFRHLSYSILQILNSAMISDRDKGLLSAEDILGPNVTRLLCLHHLKGNFIKHHGQ